MLRFLPQQIRHFIAAIIELFYRVLTSFLDPWMDRRYGIDTSFVGGKHDTAAIQRTAGRDPSRVLPSDYGRLLSLRRALRPTSGDVFIDLGCGTARALFVFANSPARECRGVDFDASAYTMASRNVEKFRGPREKIRLAQGDCAAFPITDETIIYLYNPFGTTTLRATLENVRASLEANPRKIRICFVKHPNGEVFDTADWLKLRRKVRFFNKICLIYENI